MASVSSIPTGRPSRMSSLGMALRPGSAIALALMFAGREMGRPARRRRRRKPVLPPDRHRRCAPPAWSRFGPGFASLRTQAASAPMSCGWRSASSPWASTSSPSSCSRSPRRPRSASRCRSSRPCWRRSCLASRPAAGAGARSLVGFVGVLVHRPARQRRISPAWRRRSRSAAALTTACATIAIRRLGATEAAATTVFWFAVSSLVPLGARDAVRRPGRTTPRPSR